MKKILNRPVTVLMFHLMLAAFAVFAFLRLPIELTPDVDFPQLSVVTNWREASSEMVVRNITLPIEEAASSIPNIINVSSTSSEGTSVVKVDLSKDANVNFERLELMEKLSAIKKDLPANSTFPVIKKFVPDDFKGLQGFLSYNIHGKMSLSDIQKYAEDNLKPALLGISGVGAVNVYGGARRQIYVLLNHQKMQGLGITSGDVFSAINSSTTRQTLGSIDGKSKKYFVLTGNKIHSVDELNNISVYTFNHLAIKLGSIASIVDSLANPSSFVRINGKPSVSLEISREPGTNMLDLASAVQAKISQLRKTLPTSLTLTKISDKSEDMRKEISELSNKVIISAIVIFLVVLLFFRKIFHSLIIVSSVIFSLAGGIIFLSLSGIGLNVLTLAALALSLGIVIDNNVVVVENIIRNFEEYQKKNNIINSVKELVATSLTEIKLPLIAATLTTVGALVPVFFLPDNLKPYFLQFAETSGVVILFSLLIAFMFVPVSVMVFFKISKKTAHKKENNFTTFLKKVYRGMVTWGILHKKTVLFLAIWSFGFPIWLLPSSIDTTTGLAKSSKIVNTLSDFYNQIFNSDFYTNIKPYVDYSLGGASQLFFQHVYKGELWRYGQETYLYFSLHAPQGTPPAQINKFTKQVEALLLPDKNQIKNITTRVYPGGGYITVHFDDTTAMTVVPYVIKNRLTSIAARTGGFTVSVSGFGQGYYSGGGMMPSYNIEIQGYNYKKVKEIAGILGNKFKTNPRVDNIKLDNLPWASESYQIKAIINRQNLSRYGATISDFGNEFSPLVSSELNSPPISIDNDPVSTVIKYSNYQNASFTNLPDKAITLNSKPTRVGEFVNFKIDPVMSEIKRDNQQYSRYITFDYKGPYRFGAAANRVSDKINLRSAGIQNKTARSFFYVWRGK